LAFHSGQVTVEAVNPRSLFLDPRSLFLDPRSLFLDPRSLFLDPCQEFVNDFCLPPDDGMTRSQVVGQFQRGGGHRDASLRA
jgi:hypothetical protein